MLCEVVWDFPRAVTVYCPDAAAYDSGRLLRRHEMGLNAYLTIEGEVQGKVEGSVTLSGREGAIEVHAVDHGVESPRDAATGLPAGKRQHKPLNVIKDVDKSSPLLWRMLSTNEKITELRLDFWRPSRSGREFQYYTIELINASIAGIHTEMLDNRIDDNTRLPERESVAFVYQKIIWTWQDGGVTAEDNWLTNPAR